jgi:hypothetical protein
MSQKTGEINSSCWPKSRLLRVQTFSKRGQQRAERSRSTVCAGPAP